MKALGLIQHINQQIHQLGNTLDLVYTESLEPIRVCHAFTSSYISDHHLVGIELQMKKQLVKAESSKTKSYKNFNPSDFEANFNSTSILEQDSFKQAFIELEKELTRTLDELAPLKDRRKKKQPSRSWYNATLKEQRRIVRTREHIYNRNRQLHQWKAYTRERNRYTRMLEFQKRHYLVAKVEEATTDLKQLFQAEDFASFFHDKIDNIQSRFNNIQPYKPSDKCNVPLLRKFAPISGRQLERTITSMPSKTCILDIIPTARLKEVLGTIYHH